jgi:hypothetical protein
MKPLTFGAIVFVAGTLATFWWEHRPTPSAAAKPALSEFDKEVLLCDKEVDALLHTKDTLELMRAQMIIQAENCSIGKRL